VRNRPIFHIRILGFNGVLASALTTPIDILATANLLHTRGNRRSPLFRWSVESPDGRPIRTASGQTVEVDGPIAVQKSGSAVYVASPFSEDAAVFAKRIANTVLMRALQQAHAGGAIVATHCVGTFILAEAGLLRHRKATTHWGRAKQLAALYPDIRLDIQQIVTEDDNVICGGAVTAYSNVILAIVRRLAGEELASDTARYLLIDLYRGGQAAYARERLSPQPLPTDPLVTQARNWIDANYWRPFRVAEVATALGVSERTLNRRFKEATAVPPIRFVQEVRIANAKRLLEEGVGSAQEVSERVGYEDLATFRELFKRETGMTLREYRTKFMNGRNAAPPRSTHRYRGEA
jgi:transcriptional regulator GlxA family with amidase domain